ncbi:MAG: hypothetical protein FWC41_05290 [Firmicutes bacterium]|nr:hypothetical protein [Bacillota bacterium]
MTVLKSIRKNELAVLTETTAYITDLNGVILKFYPIQNLKSRNFGEQVEFPADFEASKKEFHAREEKAKLARIESQRILAEAKAEALTSYKEGRCNAYQILMHDEEVETFGKNNDVECSIHNSELGTLHFCSEEAILEIAISLLNSWTPQLNEGDFTRNNVVGVIIIKKLKNYTDLLEELGDDYDLEDLFSLDYRGKFNYDLFESDDIYREDFSVEIPNNSIIVTTDCCYSNFNRKIYTPSAILLKGDYIYRHSNGSTKAMFYSDLWSELVFENLDEYLEYFGFSEKSVEVLLENFTLENAKKHGLSETNFYLFDKDDEESDA